MTAVAIAGIQPIMSFALATLLFAGQQDTVKIKSPEDIKEWVLQKLVMEFGIWILILAFVLLLLWKAWKEREHIKSLLP
ncbi:MAG: hypothetical protein AABZ61_09575, partial [Bacteroidota bacterium]